MSTDLDGYELCRLLDASGGFLAFAVWNLVCRIAATCARRGVLVKDGLPMTDAELARLARCPLNLIEPALQLLASPEVGLLELVPLHLAMTPPDVPDPLPRKPRIKPLLQCPVCSADLTEYYQLETQTGETHTGETLHKTEAEGQVSTPDTTPPVTAAGITEEEAERIRIYENWGATPATASDPLHQHGNAREPHRDWRPPATIVRASLSEIRDVRRRFESGQMTADDLCEYLNTHYYDTGQDDDAPDDETEDWEDEDDDGHESENEDWENYQEFLTDLPPPNRGEWT